MNWMLIKKNIRQQLAALLIGSLVFTNCMGGNVSPIPDPELNQATTYVDEQPNALYEAVQKGDEEKVRSLLTIPESAKLINATIQGNTALHIAVEHKKNGIASLLLMGGAFPNILNADSETPLHIAASKNNQGMAFLLLSYGGLPSIKNSRGQSAYALAIQLGHHQLADTLLNYPAQEKDKAGNTLLHLTSMSKTFSEGYTPKLINSLIGSQVDINAKNDDKQTALDLSMDDNNVQLAKLLIEQKADLGGMFKEIYEGGNPLLKAIKNKNEKGVLIALLANNPGWTKGKMPSGEHSSCLHLAAEAKNVSILKLLLENDQIAGMVNCADNTGSTALHVAAKYDSAEVAKLLLAHGANINQRNNQGHTPLHITAQHRSTAVAQLLLDTKVDLDQTNKVGNTPLHIAAKENAAEIVQLLLAHGANTDVENHNKQIALQLCKGQNMRDVFTNYAKK